MTTRVPQCANLVGMTPLPLRRSTRPAPEATWQDLLQRYLAALEHPSPWPDLWRLFLDHAWYQEQLRAAARRAVYRRRLPPHWHDDVQQEAMLLLARSLRAAADLHLDRARVSTHFPGWLTTIIARHCQEALRKICRQQQHTQPLGERDFPSEYPSPGQGGDEAATALDFQRALEQLPPEQRTIVSLHAQGLSTPRVAEQQGLSYCLTRRRLRSAIAQLRRRLGGDAAA